MDNTQDFEQTFALGKRALGYIRYNSSPAVPRNYELWYTYAAGHNKALVEAVQDVLDKRTHVSPEDAKRLYDLFISPTRLSDQAEKVSNEVGDEVKEIVSMLKEAALANSVYGDSLDGIGNELDNVETTSDLKVIVQRLTEETRQMAESSHELQQQLEESSKQITELNANLEAIREESITDQLTRLPNRKHFDEKLLTEIQKSQETGTPLCLLLVDIDHFKNFNDTYGHQTGDQVLRLVANTLKAGVKGRDLPARYGGEEFCIILPETNLKNAVIVANQVRTAVMNRELIKKSTNLSLGRITISVGVGQYRIGESPESLIHRADACLYAAKAAGRNQVKSEVDTGVDSSINAA